ncbi:sporulation protein Cse60 [Streptococcus porci]|uniref:sporulation protein Cse60 n=1 Tax=Streptococcus porci TaxID=502567 RepID=UPI0003F69111|nr:sporulation protein Cse60 [Streptococcus porci]
MKIKLFYQKHKQSLEEFENQVNDFMADVEVIDVKYTEATSGDYEAMTTTLGLLILYK